MPPSSFLTNFLINYSKNVSIYWVYPGLGIVPATKVQPAVVVLIHVVEDDEETFVDERGCGSRLGSDGKLESLALCIVLLLVICW